MPDDTATPAEPEAEAKAAPKFKTGDVVYLKSGGQHMTVSDVHYQSGYFYDCQWHDPAGAAQSGNYWEVMLMPSQPDAHSLYIGAQAGVGAGAPDPAVSAKDWRDKHGLR